MNKIYRSTERTLIWLGDENDTTKSVLRDLGILSKSVFPLATDADGEFIEGTDVDEIAKQYGVDDFLTMFQFFGRAWFSRIWVLQECVLDALVHQE